MDRPSYRDARTHLKTTKRAKEVGAKGKKERDESQERGEERVRERNN